jgi:glycine dehydrogenase
MLRYIFELQDRDLSLAHSMIPLGSCTMKLNATSEMIPVTWPEFGRSTRSRPAEQWKGYHPLHPARAWLEEITGFAAVSLQPNAGSQGEYAGCSRSAPTTTPGRHPRARLPRARERARHQPRVGRHGGDEGRADQEHARRRDRLRRPARQGREARGQLAALMVTYPSTCGVFEDHIRDVCDARPRARRAGLHGRREHERPGRALPTRRHRRRRLPPQPAQDVLHPARRRRARAWARSASPSTSRPFLPGTPVVARSSHGERAAIGPVSAAPLRQRRASCRSAGCTSRSWGRRADARRPRSRSSAPTTWPSGSGPLRRAVHRQNGRVAHEFVIDCRPFDKSARASRSTTSPSA